MIPSDPKRLQRRNWSEKPWWTDEEKDGHWVLVVFKEEFQIGHDPWGYPHGELKQEVLASVPQPPEVVTAAEIAKRLNRSADLPSHDFLKAVQRCLRELRAKGLSRSTPSGTGAQLVWHRPSSLLVETSENPPLGVVAPAAPIEGVPRERAPVIVERRRLAARTPKPGTILRSGMKTTPALTKLRGQVLGLVPEAPNLITACAISQRMGAGQAASADELLEAVKSQLRALQMRRLVRALPIEGDSELGWHRRSPEVPATAALEGV